MLKGPAVSLVPSAAEKIGLAIHELGTNAMKYGALATSGGQVQIETELNGEDVVMSWTETGGPAVNGVPERSGFGTQLSEIGITSQLSGEIQRCWHSTGLKVVMTMPAAHL